MRVNIMSGKAIIALDKSVAPEALIKAIGGAELKATREGEKSDDDAHQTQKQRLPRTLRTIGLNARSDGSSAGSRDHRSVRINEP